MEKIIEIIKELQAIHERNTGGKLQQQEIADFLGVSASAVTQWNTRGTTLLAMKVRDLVQLAFVYQQITTQKKIIDKEKAFIDFFYMFIVPQIAKEFGLELKKLGTPTNLVDLPIDGVLQMRVSGLSKNELIDLLENLHRKAIALLKENEKKEMISIQQLIEDHLEDVPLEKFLYECDLNRSRYEEIIKGDEPNNEEFKAIASVLGWSVDELKNITRGDR